MKIFGQIVSMQWSLHFSWTVEKKCFSIRGINRLAPLCGTPFYN